MRDRIVGASYNIGRRYQLLPEDREELVSHVHFKISKVDWRSKFRENHKWNDRNGVNGVLHPSCKWTAEEVAQIMCYGYVYTLIQKSMLDEVRRQKCGGITGLGLHPLDTIQPHDTYGFDDYREKTEGEDDDSFMVEPGVDGQANRTAALQVADIARSMLTAEEWICVSLAYGFDGGDSRTPAQVAREAKLPRKRTQELLDSALSKLRVRM